MQPLKKHFMIKVSLCSLQVPSSLSKARRWSPLHMNAEKVVDTEAEDERNWSPWSFNTSGKEHWATQRTPSLSSQTQASFSFRATIQEEKTKTAEFNQNYKSGGIVTEVNKHRERRAMLKTRWQCPRLPRQVGEGRQRAAGRGLQGLILEGIWKTL